MKLLTVELPQSYMLRLTNSHVLVIVPTLNEEEGIGPTLQELRDVLGDPFLLVVDGNSVDDTCRIAKEFGAEVVLQKGKGKGSGVAQALGKVSSSPEYVVFIDADYTYPAEYIPEMIRVLEDNADVGMVIGNRFDGRFHIWKAMRDAYYLGNRVLAFAQHICNGVDLCDPLSGLRIVRWALLEHWRPKSKCFDVEAELNYYIEKSGYDVMETPIVYRGRLGEKKLKLRHGFTILKRIFVESLSSSDGCKTNY